MILYSIPQISNIVLPVCPVCRRAVELERAKTDEQGRAIHEECYVEKMKQERARAAS